MPKVPPGMSVKSMAGLPSREQMLTHPKNTDKIPAVVTNQSGTPTAPAKISEGEFIFSVPAIIALGQGSHEKGVQMLTQAHERLMNAGKTMLSVKEQETGVPTGQGLNSNDQRNQIR